MKVEFWMIGKTAFPWITEGMSIYEKRLKHYLPFQSILLNDIKNAGKLPVAELKKKEGQLILSKLNKSDFLYLLDEKGKSFTSEQFAAVLEKRFQNTAGKVVFLVGGAFGFSPEVYARANAQISLSKMTFSHQMVRVFFLEQIYRAMTILKGEKYHNA